MGEIQFKNICKKFGDVKVIEDLNLTRDRAGYLGGAFSGRAGGQ